MDNESNATTELDETQRLEESGQPAVPVIGERVVPPNGFTRQNGAEADGIPTPLSVRARERRLAPPTEMAAAYAQTTNAASSR